MLMLTPFSLSHELLSILMTTPCDGLPKLHFPNVLFLLQTLFLFTKSDIKTVLVPVTIFSTLLVPNRSDSSSLFLSVAWTYLHLLTFCIANQTHSVVEDSLNKPWRPIPSGRISRTQAAFLRWALLTPLCIIFSMNRNALWPSVSLLVATCVYNDLSWSKDGVVKNLLNVVGYVSFEAGATLVLGSNATLVQGAPWALTLSALIILTTVHAGDIPDIDGDFKEGRRTLPIIFPNTIRPSLCATILAWTSFACWNLLSFSWVLMALTVFGLATLTIMGFLLPSKEGRTPHDRHRQDKTAFILYNAWLSGMHIALAISANAGHVGHVSMVA